MAEPKKKTTRSRRNARRAQSYKQKLTAIATCPKCASAKLPHVVCKNCGYYGGQEVIKIRV